jgi:predicted nicotinamide N-methyase
VPISTLEADILDTDPPASVILAGDVFYSREMAGRVLPFLRRAAGRGCLVLVGDPGRAYLPEGLIKQATYAVPVNESLEGVSVRETTIWQVSAH